MSTVEQKIDEILGKTTRTAEVYGEILTLLNQLSGSGIVEDALHKNDPDAHQALFDAIKHVLMSKADVAETQEAFASMATWEEVREALAQKVNISDVAGMLSNEDLEALLSQKADAESTETALAKKADTTALEEGLAKKADAEATEQSLSTKAETEALEEGLAKKADAEAMEAALAKKADAEAMATALGQKADRSEMDTKADAEGTHEALAALRSSVETKADAEDVETALAEKATAEDLTTHASKAASANEAGHAKVVNSFTSTSTTDAAAAAAVKSAYDLAALKQSALGYTPVQQGTGIGQSTNAIKIGWSANGAGARLSVDATDMGYLVTSSLGQGKANHSENADYAASAGSASTAWSPNGVLIGCQNATVAMTNGPTGQGSFTIISSEGILLGQSDRRWAQLYAVTSAISTSDAREKSLMHGDGSIPDAVVRAWGKVSFVEYQMLDAIAAKGESARVHTGMLAQQIKDAFESEGLDPFERGLLCHDAWDAQEEITETYTVEVSPAKVEMREVEITPAVLDDAGNIITPAVTLLQPVEVTPAVTEERTRIIQPARKAGDRYALRYEEALCLEAAYQRRRADAAEIRIQEAETALADVLKRLEKLEEAHG